MEKQRKWQLTLILTVILLTVYNILPTLFYYSQPLKEPINPAAAVQIGASITERVNTLEKESQDWLESFCNLLHVKPLYISTDPKNPAIVNVSFTKTEDARRLRGHLPRAGSLIPFAPAQLILGQSDNPKTVQILRKIPIRLEASDFTYFPKNDERILEARLTQIKKSLQKQTLFSDPILDLQKEVIVLKFKNKESDQKFFDELARIQKETSEELIPLDGEVHIPLHHHSQVSGYLIQDLKNLSHRCTQNEIHALKSGWQARHADLSDIKIVDFKNYQTLSNEDKALCLVVMAPTSDHDGLNPDSLYLVAKGFDRLAKQYEEFPNAQPSLDFQSDFNNLLEILKRSGYVGSHAKFAGLIADGDIVLEKPDFLSPLFAATREEFRIFSAQKMAILELQTKEHRILTENKIANKIHDDLLRWKDDYRTAQANMDENIRFDVPKPTKNPFWQNILLTSEKIFRGDEGKIIRWGLDLCGGKSVLIALKDGAGQLVKDDASLKQGINELYTRVNKMGVSEVTIRQVGNHIALDFPGTQAMTAAELIKASTMYFHVVNEKFSLWNPVLSNSVNRFLSEIWNEASIKGKKDPESLNAIAYEHLYRDARSDAATDLWENGLRFARRDVLGSNSLESDLCRVAVYKESEPASWGGQTHPLLIVFNNWVLEGASLQNIRAGYDPQKGNFLNFDVVSSLQNGENRTYPREDFFAWTSRYSQDEIMGTDFESYSRGKGWRMAVILNDFVINAPTLNTALKDSATISGSFSQREVNQLAADLKAGSLTFTPQILSEKNISPELGKSDRLKGIGATAIALILVIGSMLAYYRFAGLVASVAVLFNLLILWATLQNLGAALTLAGLAAVILTIGMAIDANVLVFERVKEEFALSNNLRSALYAGYKKAYSAIIDSNVTTIIAALILLNFDAGPIKSFAVNLIIGIASSMFTALFLTRFYFTGWVQKPKNTVLTMANWIKTSSYDFLSKAKPAFVIAAAIIAIGTFLIVKNQNSIFGMDFTGGYSLNLELENAGLKNYAQDVEKALIASGASPHDFQVRELDPPHNLRILFARSMELSGKPFFGMGQGNVDENPRIVWVASALQTSAIALAANADLNSNWTSVSGQMSDTMRNNALIGLAIAFFCIFVYLSFRFEYKFAAAALICLFYDVFITMGLFGILHGLGLEMQIDLNTIAAIMTIIGYSLNDKIIVFDRIREEMKDRPTKKLPEIVNYALNATLSRTAITSGTTLLVLLALVLFGGPSIFGFSLVMTIGVFFGTLSSWFIAAPLMIFFHKREEAKEKALA